MIELERRLFGYPISCRATILDSGVHVLLTGGSRSHVGAVSACEPGKAPETMTFPGHRDDAVSAPWAAALAEKTRARAVVAVGIHYDGVGRAEIGEILSVTDAMLKILLREISGLKNG